MPTLVNITQKTPQAVQVWGFHGPCTVNDVAAALNTIGASLVGAGNTIHVMSDTHGYCAGKVGAVATREQKFAAEDRALTKPATKDRQPVAVDVQDFNNDHLDAPGVDVATLAMAKLNTDIRRLAAGPGTHTFLLAYCCSAGTA